MFRLVLASVWYYRQSSLAVILAITISTAVIGGSLIVGDSVRSSLQQMSLERLGGISHILSSPRFFRQQLAAEMQLAMTEELGVASDSDRLLVSPALLLTGTLESASATKPGSDVRSPAVMRHRAGSTTILGVTDAVWQSLETGTTQSPSVEGIVLGHQSAVELKVKTGDRISLWIERPSTIPRDSLLGEREDVNIEIVLRVEGVLSETDGASRFSMHPGQQLPYNAFVRLELLQDRLGIAQVEATDRNPVSKPARINTIVIGHKLSNGKKPSSKNDLAELIRSDMALQKTITEQLDRHIAIEDAGLLIRTIPSRGLLSMESESMILEDSLSEAVVKASQDLGLETAPMLVYLANEIRAADHADADSRYSMYSIVASLPKSGSVPLGPWALADGSPIPELMADDIVLSDWLRQDLQVAVGDSVDIRWHEVGSHGDLPETHRRFVVRGILKADDPVSVDQDLTPFVDGVTNVNSFSDWDQPFPMEMKRITARDDEYWEKYRATPKAFVSPETAQSLWSSRFGRNTSIRVASPGVVLSEDRLTEIKNRLAFEIRPLLEPLKLGLFFRPIRAEGLQASVGANDFTVLFLGFSSFLILSAILLAALMYRLGIQQRIAQIGLLEALGFTRRGARSLFLAEGLVNATAGALLGSAAAVGFGKLMIYGLTNWWVGAIGTRFLVLDVRADKLAIAGTATLVLAVIVIWQSLRACTQRPPRELLAGISDGNEETSKTSRASLWSLARSPMYYSVVAIAVALPVLAIRGLVPAGEAFGGMSWQVVSFFLAGLSWLVVGLWFLQRRLKKRRGETIQGRTVTNIGQLVIANTARNAQRSFLTTALIAFATFVIVAAGAARRNPVSEIPDKLTGNGGFSLVAETSQPVLFDLNIADDRKKLSLDTTAEESLSASVKIYSFRVRPGEDASCLNLYQATTPTLLGAQQSFIERGGFRFADTPSNEPWQLLQQAHPDQDGLPVIPVIGDMNTLQYSLKKGLNSVILFPSAESPQYALKVVGMLDSSIFQGVLVMTDANLQRVSPDSTGASYFLIDTGNDRTLMHDTASLLESGLNAFGFDAEPVSQRLAGFLAVQNTYLSTFHLLGGLGLLVGTFGLAAVMIRNILERRRELALMKALGFTGARIIGLVLFENWFLLFWGILTGAASAMIAMLPHLQSTGADVPWVSLGMTLGAVAAIGSIAAAFPVITAARTQIRDALAA